MSQIFWDCLWFLSSMVYHHLGVFWLIGFYSCHHYFYIQYNCCFEHFLFLLVCNNLLLVVQKGILISNYFVFDCLIFSFYSYVLTILSLVYSIIFDKCWFSIILGCICFKKTHHFVLNTTHHFLMENSYLTNLTNSTNCIL